MRLFVDFPQGLLEGLRQVLEVRGVGLEQGRLVARVSEGVVGFRGERVKLEEVLRLDLLVETPCGKLEMVTRKRNCIKYKKTDCKEN